MPNGSRSQPERHKCYRAKLALRADYALAPRADYALAPRADYALALHAAQ